MLNKINLKNKSPLGIIVANGLLQKGKTQKYLANKMNITEGALSHILSGRYNPSINNVYIMSELLDIDIGDIKEIVFIDNRNHYECH